MTKKTPLTLVSTAAVEIQHPLLYPRPIDLPRASPRDVPDTTIRAWTAFAADQGDRTSAELVSDLRALNPALDPMSAHLTPGQAV